MQLSLTSVFVGYLAVFLAGIFATWFFYVLQRRRRERSAYHILICGFCQADILPDQPSWRIRCPVCGAVQRRKQLKEKKEHGHVDRQKS